MYVYEKMFLQIIFPQQSPIPCTHIKQHPYFYHGLHILKKNCLLGLILQLKYCLHCEIVCAITWMVCFHLFCCFHQYIIPIIKKPTSNAPTFSCSNASSLVGVSTKTAVSSSVVVKRHATLPYGSTSSLAM